ncbi:MAG: glycosyltransferase family 2 protein [Chloroflexi bacterium]|nr:glycosyltransferase family 2 protein [Chloroflexota bacterium]
MKSLVSMQKDGLPRITALICTLNEAANIPHILAALPPFVSEILVVDGHSTDGTVEVINSLCPQARILYQPGKGKGDALRYGIQNATGDIVVTLDADGSLDPAEMPRFIEPLLNGNDFAKGSRFLPGGGTDDMPRHRLFGNWVFTTLVNLLFGARYTDLCYGYNAFWRKALEGIEFHTDSFAVETELNINIHRAHLKIAEVPSYERARFHGQGKLRSFRDGARILKTIFGERFRRPEWLRRRKDARQTAPASSKRGGESGLP